MPNHIPADHQFDAERNETGHAEDAATSQSVGSSTPDSTRATHTPAKRGFAAMDEAMQRTIASKGGQSQGKANNPGNFANNRERAREAGRKGGEAHGHRANRAHPNDQSTHHP
jgi:uncharacterized protein